MIYGLYLSATGIQTSSHNQDVIANNLANAETSGFKRSLAIFEQRQIEAKARNSFLDRDPVLDKIGGGQWLAPTAVDRQQGALEESGRPLDLAFVGSGYFAVDQNSQLRLSRDGKLALDRDGNLILSNTPGSKVLDADQKPIQLVGYRASDLAVDKQGTIRHGTTVLAKLGLFEPADPRSVIPTGDNLNIPTDPASLRPATGTIESGQVERSNVDPTTELTRLMEAQRLLEANANMIKYQDQTLGKLVNEVGRIS